MKKEIVVKEYEGIKLNIYNLDNRKFQGEEIGRNDINGIPIKECDIISIGDIIHYGGVVVYNPISCAFCFEYENIDESHSFSSGWSESQESPSEQDWKIVGSIYGNK